MKNTIISNLINNNGRAVANQFIITDFVGDYDIAFQSYDSTVVMRNHKTEEILLGKDWEYSRTTMKYVVFFLNHYLGLDSIKSVSDIRKALKNGRTVEGAVLIEQ